MIINKRESAYFFIGMLNRMYVSYNLHSIKKKKGYPFFLSTTNETDDCDNQDDEQGEGPTNPIWFVRVSFSLCTYYITDCLNCQVNSLLLRFSTAEPMPI